MSIQSSSYGLRRTGLFELLQSGGQFHHRGIKLGWEITTFIK